MASTLGPLSRSAQRRAGSAAVLVTRVKVLPVAYSAFTTVPRQEQQPSGFLRSQALLYTHQKSSPFQLGRHESTISSGKQITPPVQYTYDDMKKLSMNPVADIIIVDVREPAELATEGFIPTAINIPYKSSPEALALSDDAFEDKFGFPKPSKDKTLVFYCLGGVRCNFAQDLAGEAGYEKRGNYAGSWEDWVQHESAKK
ncbi:uncharacterized protein V1518DRAFT_218356 [Limtongia smithiae]|uniref:uncharacterized protein n=1 Tax=Limtongia smithiae TaxID=1125753 RepID=UPI0034CE45C9